jgi:hypothetical protein
MSQQKKLILFTLGLVFGLGACGEARQMGVGTPVGRNGEDLGRLVDSTPADEEDEYFDITDEGYVILHPLEAGSLFYFVKIKIQDELMIEETQFLLIFEDSSEDAFLLNTYFVKDRPESAIPFPHCWLTSRSLYFDNPDWGSGTLHLPEGIARANMNSVLPCASQASK